MPLDHYVTLGRSALRVSPFCLGTMTFGMDWGWGSEVDDANAIMDAYIDRGGNFLDTANIYTKGHSEKIIGDHIGKHAARRDRVVIATKFQGNMFPGDPNAGGAGRKAIIGACEESLRRLQTDYIDLYWMHWLDDHSPIDETMRTLDDLVRTGKVRYIGFSDTPAWRVVQAQYEAIFRSWTPLVGLQIEYSLAERTVEHDLIPMAQQMGLGVTPWSPLKGGVLTGKFTRADVESGEVEKKAGRGQWVANHMTERNLAIVDALVSVAEEMGRTPAEVALAWVQSRSGVASTSIGARTMDQLDKNLAALDVTLTEEHTARLDEVSEPAAVFPHNFLPYTINNTQGGTTINGREAETWHMAPQNDDERW